MKIKHIDTSVGENIELLNKLQRECLPSDTLYDVRLGDWWIAVQNGKAVGSAGIVRSARWIELVIFVVLGSFVALVDTEFRKDLFECVHYLLEKWGGRG